MALISLPPCIYFFGQFIRPWRLLKGWHLFPVHSVCVFIIATFENINKDYKNKILKLNEYIKLNYLNQYFYQIVTAQFLN